MAKHKKTDAEKFNELSEAIAKTPEYRAMLRTLGSGSEANGESLLDIMLKDTMRRLANKRNKGNIKEGN